jgi:hypothetical protein
MPIGLARTGRDLGLQQVDRAQEIVANGSIAEALAVKWRIAAGRTVAERLATVASVIVRLLRGMFGPAGRRVYHRVAEPHYLGAAISGEPVVTAGPVALQAAGIAPPHFAVAGAAEAGAFEAEAAEEGAAASAEAAAEEGDVVLT